MTFLWYFCLKNGPHIFDKLVITCPYTILGFSVGWCSLLLIALLNAWLNNGSYNMPKGPILMLGVLTLGWTMVPSPFLLELYGVRLCLVTLAWPMLIHVGSMTKGSIVTPTMTPRTKRVQSAWCYFTKKLRCSAN
jgi:hypothetical protein